MSIKSILIFSFLALLIQAISAQCVVANNADGYSASWGPAPLAAATVEWAYAPAATLVASNGPGLATSSTSYRIPSGVSVISENAYEGALAVGGTIPFLGATGLEGILSTAGAGAIAYDCGNGALGITVEDIDVYDLRGIASPLSYEDGTRGHFVYGSGIGFGPCGYGDILNLETKRIKNRVVPII